VRARRPLTEIRLSPTEGKLLAEIHRDGEVLDQRMDDDRLVLRARVDAALAGRLRHAGAEVTAVAGGPNGTPPNGTALRLSPDDEAANGVTTGES
ncbi:MAG TPA: hypothetical protein VJU87_08590, partial [Gemmatimonadaceae bacterium]|nr:hypothetical protein [Gemmatimonadaceae bacterium]